jgi:ADP-ribosyl-[dinitrogen reductase] hydrolase
MGASTSAKPTPLRNSYWVIPGKVLAGEHPGAANREATREKLQRLIDAGVDCFIDLTEPNEIRAYDRELPFSVEYLRKPIKDHGTPAQRVHMAEILDCMHDALQSGRCVYVHCRAGIGRTGTVIGCFLVERGLPGESALDELNRLWQQCERSHSWASIPETSDQTDYVLRWKRRGIFDDRGGLTTPDLKSADDEDDLRSGSGPALWAHLLGNGQQNSSASRPAPNAPRSPTSPGAPALAPAKGPAAGGSPAAAKGPAAGASSGARLPADAAPSVSTQPSPNASPPSALSSPLAAGAPRAVVANAARAAARESDGEELLTDPTSVSKLPQARTSRPDVPGWIGSGSATAPIASPGPNASSASDPAAAGSRSSPGTSPRTGRAGGSGSLGSARPDGAATAGANNAVPGKRGSTPKVRDAALANPPASTRLGNSGVSQSVEDAVDMDPLLDPEALTAASNLRDRFLGALVGLAIGDAVAAATQYRRPGSFPPVGDMLGGGPFELPRGAWSDDTAMALCLADSLLERNVFDARDQMERYRRWQQQGYLSATGQCVGITASTARAIAMAQWRRQALFGSHDPSQQDPEPLSRVAAAVLFFFATSGEAINQATEAARTTCQAPAVLDACRALACAMYAALTGQPKAIVLEKAALAVATPMSPAAPGSATEESPSGVGPGGAQRVGSSAPAALAAAVAAFGATDNFRDAILYAANLGGDSDVVAAVCGQLAGAYYSVKAIPTSWYNGLMQKELITGYADRLLAHAMVALSG